MRGSLEIMDPQFEELKSQVAESVKSQLEDFEKRIEWRMQVHFERVDALVKRAAEGYGQTLGSIDRRLDRLETKLTVQS